MANEFVNTTYGRFSAAMREDRLADVCVSDAGVQTGPFGSQLHQEDYVETGTPIITVEHLGENRILQANLPHVSNEDRNRLSKYQMREGDIIFSRVGSVDRRALVRFTENGWLFSGRCLRVRPDRRKIDPGYLSYFFGLPTFKAHIRSIAVGATMPSLNTQILSDVPIVYPEDVDEQRAIAHILGTLDDKIELNRRMNETLEAIARAIFKSWFVDFDPVRAKADGEPPESICRRLRLTPDLLALFPDRLVDSELGEIPAGWSVGAFHNCCDRVESGGTPSRSVAEYWNGTIRWLTSGEVRDVIVLDTKEKITDAGLNASSAKVWPKGATVVAMYGATAGQICLLAEEMTANQACCALIPKPEFASYVFLAARGSIAQLSDKASGSAQQNLNKSLVANHQLIIPELSVANAFEKLVSCLIEKWISNQREGVTLATLRDTLLPKLLSGELSVPEAEGPQEALLA